MDEFWRAGLGGNYTLVNEIYKQSNYKERRELLESRFNNEPHGEETLLHAAVRMRNIELIHLLVTNGADIDAKNHQRSNSPLILSAFYNFTDICKLLLYHGADPNIKNSYGLSAVHYALQNTPNIDLINLLVANSANFPTLYFILKWDSTLRLSDLIKTIPKRQLMLTDVDTSGNTALHQAVKSNNIEITRTLLAKGAEVNARNKAGEIPLYWCLFHNSTGMCKELIASGSHIDVVGIFLKNNITALEIASALKNFELIKIILQNGAKFSLADFVSGFYNNENIGVHYLKELIKLFPLHRSEINEMHHTGFSALHFAVKNAHVDVVNELLSMSANVSKVSMKFQSILKRENFRSKSVFIDFF